VGRPCGLGCAGKNHPAAPLEVRSLSYGYFNAKLCSVGFEPAALEPEEEAMAFFSGASQFRFGGRFVGRDEDQFDEADLGGDRRLGAFLEDVTLLSILLNCSPCIATVDVNGLGTVIHEKQYRR